MGWTVAPERPAVLLHFSEDPGIAEFGPHVPRSNPGVTPAVWAIDPARAPLYWFPRDCPRVAVWANDAAQQALLAHRLATEAARVHAVPLEWNERMRVCALYEYRFDPAPFAPWPDAEGQWVAHERVVPVAVEPVGDLITRHAAAGVDLRFVNDLAPLRDLVVESGLPFSIVRWSRTI
jgi:hypothetical protein